MTRSPFLFALPAVLALGCTMQTYDFEDPSMMEAPPKAIHGVPLPDSDPIRELYTECREVKNAKGVVGYVVVYQELPAYEKSLSRRYPAGTILVENAKFRLFGVITPYGTGTRFSGEHEEQLGRGSLDELLPKFFGEKGLSHSPLSK